MLKRDPVLSVNMLQLCPLHVGYPPHRNLKEQDSNMSKGQTTMNSSPSPDLLDMWAITQSKNKSGCLKLQGKVWQTVNIYDLPLHVVKLQTPLA